MLVSLTPVVGMYVNIYAKKGQPMWRDVAQIDMSLVRTDHIDQFVVSAVQGKTFSCINARTKKDLCENLKNTKEGQYVFTSVAL